MARDALRQGALTRALSRPWQACAYYFVFAVICWFFYPTIFIAPTLAVVFLQYSRAFWSEVLAVLWK